MPSNQVPETENWAETLFVKHPHLYLPVLESMKEEAKLEVDGLCRVLEEFRVEKESKVLDFSCGIGRHSVNLAKRGFHMVGYDPSQVFIEKAKLLADQELRGERQKIRFYNGIIRDCKEVLSSNNEFNFKAIIIMFNSIGYISEDDDIRILQQLLSLADKGCILIMQTLNRDWRIMNTPNDLIAEFDKLLINEVWKVDQYTSVAQGTSKFYERNSRDSSLDLRLELQMRLRLYSLHEIRSLVNAAGWNFLKSYGDIKSLDKVSMSSIYPVTISQKT